MDGSKRRYSEHTLTEEKARYCEFLVKTGKMTHEAKRLVNGGGNYTDSQRHWGRHLYSQARYKELNFYTEKARYNNEQNQDVEEQGYGN